MFPFPTPLLCAQAAVASGPSFVAAGALAAQTGGSTLAVAYPAGIAANDILFLHTDVADASGIADVTGITGSWTSVISSELASVDDAIAGLYWKRAAGTETGTETITYSEAVNLDAAVAIISAWRNCATTGEPFERINVNTQSAVTSLVGPDVTTTGTDRRVLTFFGHVINGGTQTSGSNTNGWDENWDLSTATGRGATLGGVSIAASASGTVSGCTRTLANSTSSIALALALVPVGGSPPARAVTVRASNIAYVNNSSSATFTLPTGSAAGDWCLMFVAHGFSVTAPTGWTVFKNLTGTNWNGAAFEKELTSADITAGTVSLSFSGVYFGIVAGITFTQRPSYIRCYNAGRNSTGASSRGVTVPNFARGTPQSGDYVVTFGSGRFNGTVTANVGSSLQTTSNANASGALYGGALGSSGSLTSTVSFSATPTGDFEAVVVLTP
jgi:hypothetical protein